MFMNFFRFPTFQVHASGLHVSDGGAAAVQRLGPLDGVAVGGVHADQKGYSHSGLMIIQSMRKPTPFCFHAINQFIEL